MSRAEECEAKAKVSNKIAGHQAARDILVAARFHPRESFQNADHTPVILDTGRRSRDSEDRAFPRDQRSHGGLRRVHRCTCWHLPRRHQERSNLRKNQRTGEHQSLESDEP